jgi:hypothetical protein
VGLVGGVKKKRPGIKPRRVQRRAEAVASAPAAVEAIPVATAVVEPAPMVDVPSDVAPSMDE